MMERNDLKALYKILFVFAILLVVFFYTNTSVKENEVLKSPSKTYPEQSIQQKSSDVMPRPKIGFSTYVGKKASEIEEKLGKPDRIGPSAYGFKWWVYNRQPDEYLLVGVEKGKVVQVYVTGEQADASPFTMGQTIEDLYRNTITDTEVHVNIEESTYTFMLSEADLYTRLLVMYDGVYAQLFFDGIEGELEAVRYLDGKTLVKTQPYDMTYVGDMIEPKTPSSFVQQKINEENALQLAELTNMFRAHHDLPIFVFNEQVNDLASSQSNAFARGDAEEGSGLKQNLKNEGIPFESAAENAAEDYVDAPEAIHSFINSDKHRTTMLEDTFTTLGTGAYAKNYVQIFIESSEPTSDSK